METKQTAVEWLYMMMNNIYRDNQETNKKLLNKAKEIEKEQIMQAYSVCDDCGTLEETEFFSEKYYNETYGK